MKCFMENHVLIYHLSGESLGVVYLLDEGHDQNAQSIIIKISFI